MTSDATGPEQPTPDEGSPATGEAVNDAASTTSSDRPYFELDEVVANVAVNDVITMLAEQNDPPRIFVRGGHLARVRFDENHRPLIDTFSRPADGDALRTELERRIDFVKISSVRTKDDPPVVKTVAKPRHAPRDLVQSVRTRGDWPGIPPLEAIVQAPTLRAGGELVDEPGYDAPSRLLYHPAPGLQVPTVPRKPPRAAVTAAVELVDDVLADFPWATSAARANAYALLLTPLVRPAIAGTVPLALVSGTKAGTGKGLLVDVVSRITSGRAPGLTAVPGTDDEMDKRIGALLMAGSTFIAFDEADELRSSSLALALTATIVKPRILGQSTMVELPQRATWVACGNNIRIRGDLHRRCYMIRLDAKLARPYERTGFRHPNLIEHVAAHRGELLGAALTIARAWYAAGSPPASIPAVVGGFESWTTTIGGILAHAGIDGFLANHIEENRLADEDGAEWEAFLVALHTFFEGRPFTVGDVLRRIQGAGDSALVDAMPADLAEQLQGATAASGRSRLGKALRDRKDTRYGDHGHRLAQVAAGTSHAGIRWEVQTDAEVRRSAEVLDLPMHARARARTHESGGKTSSTSEPPHSETQGASA